jgi:hypothetical protein
MVKRSFTVRALWDDEAKVYFSESDIIGLHIEAPTLEEFEAAMMELGPELIKANHIEQSAMTEANFADFIPAIVWERPTNQSHAV